MRLSRFAAAVALITTVAMATTGVGSRAESVAGRPAARAAAWHTLGATAVPPFGPKIVVMTTCALPRTSTDERVPTSVVTALGPAGGVYGFASCRTRVPGAMYFFYSRAGHSMHELAPYRGSLEAMASDGTGAVYLCYSVRSAHDTWLYMARRSAQGAYSPPTPVTHTVGTFRPRVTLAAAPGAWWLVWSEATSAEQFPFPPRQVLYERRTLFGVRARHQITFPSTYYFDWAPALAVEGQLARLAWMRIFRDSPSGPGPLITGLSPNGAWGTGYFLPADALASYPTRMVISQGRTYLVFANAVFLDHGTGHLSVQPSVRNAGRRYLAVSAGVATIAMQQAANHARLPYVAIDELRSGVWSSASWFTVDDFDGVVSWNGHASLVMHKQNTPMLYLVTEQ